MPRFKIVAHNYRPFWLICNNPSCFTAATPSAHPALGLHARIPHRFVTGCPVCGAGRYETHISRAASGHMHDFTAEIHDRLCGYTIYLTEAS